MEQMIADVGRFWIQPLYEINKNVSPDLWNAVKKGLEPNPKSRFSSISEMKQIIITVFRENYRIN
jgi:serine/threonine protein kinase